MLDAPRPSPSFWKRLIAGALVIVAASAAATAALAFNELDKLTDALASGRKLNIAEELAKAEPGEPQTIMLIGSDKRADTPQTDPGEFGDPRSDTVILVRLDPQRGATAIMSLPRDLRVQIPGHGTGKLNDAYSLGGVKLTVRTVKDLTGLRINHVVNIGFGGFIDAVNRLGCIYTDVDRSYFSQGIEYAYINLDAGYQRLCGKDALAYVRFRHEDNDLVRSARQQEFLRQAKEQITVGQIFGDYNRLLEIFGKSTDSDIRSEDETLKLLKLGIAAATQPVREVHFRGHIGEIYVTTTAAQVEKMTEEFLGVQETQGPRGDPREDPGPGGSGGGSGGSGGGSSANLVDATAEGSAQAEQVRAEQPEKADLPVFYPTDKLEGSVFSEPPSVYRIDVPGEKAKPAYRMVLHTGLVGEYYGLQGTTWKEAPILAGDPETRVIDGRTYELHYDGDRLRMVAWETARGVYWVSNTLLQTLSEKEMIGIATSARKL